MKLPALLCVAAAWVASAGAAGATPAEPPCPAGVPKVAFVFEGPAWEPHRSARDAVAGHLGGAVCVRTFDHLVAGVDPDANARFLLGTLGLERYALVFLLTPRHAEALGRVAPQFPATTFLQLEGQRQAPNLVPYRLDHYQAGRVAGLITAARSTTGAIAYAHGSAPGPRRAWDRGLAAGAKRVRPDVQLSEWTSADLSHTQPDAFAVSGASAGELASLAANDAPVVAWSETPPPAADGKVVRLWADWQPFYLAAAQCAVSGRKWKAASVVAGIAQGVISGDARARASSGWQEERRRAGTAAPLCY